VSAGANFQTNYMLAVQLQGLQQLRELASLLADITRFNNKQVDVKLNIDPGSLRKITQQVEDAASKADVSPRVRAGAGSASGSGTVNLSPRATSALEQLNGLPAALKEIATAINRQPLNKDATTGVQANAKAELGKIEAHLKEMKDALASIAAHGSVGGSGGVRGGYKSAAQTEVETVANSERQALERTRRELQRSLDAFQSVVTLNEANIRTQGQELRAWANMRRAMLSLPESRGREAEVRELIDRARTSSGARGTGYDYNAKGNIDTVGNDASARMDALGTFHEKFVKKFQKMKMDLVDQVADLEDKIAGMPTTVTRARTSGGSYGGGGGMGGATFDMKPIETAFDRIAQKFAATLTAAFEKIPSSIAAATHTAIPELAANTINGTPVESQYAYNMSGKEQELLSDYYGRQRTLAKAVQARKVEQARAAREAQKAAGYYNMADSDFDALRKGAPHGLVPVKAGSIALPGNIRDWALLNEVEYQKSLQFRSGTNPGAEFTQSRPPRADQSAARWARPDDPDWTARIAALKASEGFVQDHGRGGRRLDKDAIARRMLRSNERMDFIEENSGDDMTYLSTGQVGKLKGMWTRAHSILNKASKSFGNGGTPSQEMLDQITGMGGDPILSQLVGGGTSESSINAAKGAVSVEIKRLNDLLDKMRMAQHDIGYTTAGRNVSPRHLQVDGEYRTITPFNTEMMTDPLMRKRALRHVGELEANGWAFQPLTDEDEIAKYRVSSLLRMKSGHTGKANSINRFLEEGGEWYQTRHGFKGFNAAEHLFDMGDPTAASLLNQEKAGRAGPGSADVNTERLAKAIDMLGNAKLDPIVAAFKQIAEYTGMASSNISRINKESDGQFKHLMQTAGYIDLAKTKGEVKDASTVLRADQQVRVMQQRFDLFGAGGNGGIGADNLSAARRSLAEKLRDGISNIVGGDPTADAGRALKGVERSQGAVERMAALAAAARAQGLSDSAFTKPYMNAGLGYDAALTGLMGPAEALAKKYPNRLGDVSDLLTSWKGVRSERDMDASVAGRYDEASKRAGMANLSPEAAKAAQAEMAAATQAVQGRGVSSMTELNARVKERTALENELKVAIGQRVAAEHGSIKAEESSVGFLSRVGSKIKSLTAYGIATMVLYGTYQKVMEAYHGAVSNERESAEIAGMRGGSSLDERFRIKDETIKAARDYGASIKDVFAITREFIREGLPLNEAMQRTRAVLMGTEALGLHRETAREVLQANESITGGLTSGGEIMDKIAKVSSNNPVTADDMATAIMRVAPIMSQMMPGRLGQMDPMDAAMGATTAIIEKTRVSGQSAATSLSMILGRLLSPSVGKQLQNNYGVMLGGSTPNEMRPVTDIISDLARTYKSLTAKGDTIRANSLLQEIGGPRQVNATAALLSGWNRAMEVATESSTAFGEAQRKLAVEMNTNSKQSERMSSAWSGFTDRLLEVTHILPALMYTFKGATWLLGVMSGRGVRLGGVGDAFGGDRTDFDNGSIDKSDLVRDYRKQAAEYALTPQGLRRVVLDAVSNTKSAVAGMDFFKGAGLTEDSVFNTDNGKTNRKLSAATTKELVAQLDKTIPGFKDLGDEAKRAAIALKLVSDTQAQENVYLGIRVADLSDNMQKSTQAISERFAEAINGGGFTRGVSQVGGQQLYDIKSGTYHMGGGRYSRAKTLSDFSGFLTNQFGGDFSKAMAGPGGFQFSQGGNILTQAVDAMEKMPNKIHNFGEALDHVTQTMLTMSSSQQKEYNAVAAKTPRREGETTAAYEMRVAGMLTGGSNTVAVNRAMFDQQIFGAMQHGFGVDQMAREALNSQNGRNGINANPGGIFQQAVVASMVRVQKDLIDDLKKRGMTDEAKSYSRVLSVIGNDANRQKQFANLLGDQTGLGSIKERLLDAMIQANVKFQEIKGTSAAFGYAGISYDPNREKENVLRSAVTGLSGVRALAEGDWMKALLRQHYLGQQGAVAAQGMEGSEFLGRDGRPVSGADLSTTIRGAYMGLNSRQQQSLGKSAELAKKMIDELDSTDTAKLPKPLQEWIAKFQQNGVNTKTGEGMGDLLLNLPSLTKWFTENLKTIHDINTALEDQLTLIKYQADLEQQRLQYGREQTKANFDFGARMSDLSTPYSGGGLRIRGIVSDQAIAKAQVEATYQAVLADLQKKADANPVYATSTEYAQARTAAGRSRTLGINAADNAAMSAANELVRGAKLDAFAARQADLIELMKQIVQPMKDFLKGLLDDPRHFKGHRAAETMVPAMASALNSRISSHIIDSIFGDQTKIGKTLTNLFGMSDTMLQQETIRKGVYAGTLEALREVLGPGAAGTSATTTAAGGGIGGMAVMAAGAAAVGGAAAGARALQNSMRTGGLITPEQLKTMTPEQIEAAKKAGKLNKDGTVITGRQQAGMMLAQVGGQIGGSIIAGRMNGGYNYGAEGSSFGSTLGGGIGMMVGGPVGSMIGSVIGGLGGGLLGGLFHKKRPPAEAPEYVALEKIERNTRETVTAVENSTKRLADLDTRFLNAPANFTVPGYRPMGVGSGGGASLFQDNRTVQIDVHDATDPVKVGQVIQQVLSGDLRGAGTFLTMRTSS
jgi:hypothetical protein